MSLYNDAEHLNESLKSILSQEGVSFEFIIVNDGSTDDSATIIEEHAARDNRIRVIHQENQGLTKSLILGCSVAKGEYIARQDVGDISLPGRLRKQLDMIKSTADVTLISCATRFIGPGGEYLYEIIQDPSKSTEKILSLNLNVIQGVSHHGSTLFSKELYDKVGGYRPEFYFAQDLDLWVRLAEHGKYIPMPEVLYEASFSIASISGSCRNKQIELTKLIIESSHLRRTGMNDAPVLKKANTIRPDNSSNNRKTKASALYFIGACLRKQKNSKARNYFKQSIKAWPLHLKSWLRLIC